MPLSIILQFYWWRKPEYLEKTIDLSQVTDKLPVQSVPITTKVVNLNLAYGEVYSIQHYVMTFVSDFRQSKSITNILIG
jgi:hypothetical protein